MYISLDIYGVMSSKEAKERKAGIFVVQNHRYQKTKNRLLKVCYMPGTNARLPRLPFFDTAVNSTNEADKAGCMRH
jgi:hypothetical protein